MTEKWVNNLTVIKYIASCRDYLVTISKVLIPTTITTTVKIQQQRILNFYCKKLTYVLSYDNSIKAICYQGWLSIITYISILHNTIFITKNIYCKKQTYLCAIIWQFIQAFQGNLLPWLALILWLYLHNFYIIQGISYWNTRK